MQVTSQYRDNLLKEKLFSLPHCLENSDTIFPLPQPKVQANQRGPQHEATLRQQVEAKAD